MVPLPNRTRKLKTNEYLIKKKDRRGEEGINKLNNKTYNVNEHFYVIFCLHRNDDEGGGDSCDNFFHIIF